MNSQTSLDSSFAVSDNEAHLDTSEELDSNISSFTQYQLQQQQPQIQSPQQQLAPRVLQISNISEKVQPNNQKQVKVNEDLVGFRILILIICCFLSIWGFGVLTELLFNFTGLLRIQPFVYINNSQGSLTLISLSSEAVLMYLVFCLLMPALFIYLGYQGFLTFKRIQKNQDNSKKKKSEQINNYKKTIILVAITVGAHFLINSLIINSFANNFADAYVDNKYGFNTPIGNSSKVDGLLTINRVSKLPSKYINQKGWSMTQVLEYISHSIDTQSMDREDAKKLINQLISSVILGILLVVVSANLCMFWCFLKVVDWTYQAQVQLEDMIGVLPHTQFLPVFLPQATN